MARLVSRIRPSLLCAFVALLLAPAAGLAQGTDDAGDETAGEWVELKKGLRYLDLEVGEGEEAKRGSLVQMHYTGWLEDGTQFQSSHDSGQPFAFQLGRGQVIQGWERGVLGMREGGRRRLEIPFALAYGRRGRPPLIPKSADLVFEVELISVSPGVR